MYHQYEELPIHISIHITISVFIYIQFCQACHKLREPYRILYISEMISPHLFAKSYRKFCIKT